MSSRDRRLLTRASLTVALPLALLAACGDDPAQPDAGVPDAGTPDTGPSDTGPSDGGVMDAGPGLTSDCERYDASTLSGSNTGEWRDNQVTGVVIDTVTIPEEDRGGGYVEVDLFGYENFQAGAIARVELGAEVIASSGPTGRAAPTNVAFAAAPGGSYQIVGVQNLDGQNHPIPVTASWSFTSLVDCWEPNDTRDEASRFLLGETVEAYFFAGFSGPRAPQDGELDDWYVVRLEEAASSAEFLVESLPANKSNRFQVYYEDEERPAGSVLTEAGSDAVSVTVAPAAAGDYYLRLSEFLVPDAVAARDQPLPDNWSDTYLVEVEVTP